MGHSSRALVRLLIVAALFPMLPSTRAAANELPGSVAATGLVIHGAAETLRDFCSRDAEGRLWLTLPGGARHELITSTTDPAIFNPGDGAFHPFDESIVRSALAALSFPTRRLRADVFLLPYPRRNGLESAAGSGLVLLSPGVRVLSPEQQHAEFIHELGHVVHRALMPDSDAVAWDAYRALRGIGDASVFSANAPHVNRPHEIFAEDFRALFGDALANYSGTIENASITRPAQVPGLYRFLFALADAPLALAIAATPNPTRGPVRFARTGGPAVMLDVFDAQGRRAASLAPIATGDVLRWNWDGLGPRGGAAGAGVFYARPRDGSGASVRFARLP